MVQGSAAEEARHWSGTVTSIVEDLSKLSPKRLMRRLEELSREALPCVSVSVFDGNPHDGLTVGLWVESHGRRDILDVARVLEEEPRGHVATAWSLLHPGRDQPLWRLLLHVDLQRPINCTFVVRFDVHDGPSDQLRQALPLLLAASGFGIAFDRMPTAAPTLLWVPAPTARDCVFEALVAEGV
jgi:hypothetical protein